ncbi:MAG: gamma carbonic anhydrase family protein [Actinocatenispora sp.]
MHHTPLVLRLGELAPDIAPSATVLAGATVVGDVRLAEHASVFYGAVLRADSAPITVGARSNIQDGAVLHADPGHPATIGAGVTVGHGAVVHGARVDDGCLVGMRATLLNGVHIGAGSLVAAGAVVREGTEIPAGSLVAGVPARVVRPVRDEEVAMIDRACATYLDLARRHRTDAAPAP